MVVEDLIITVLNGLFAASTLNIILIILVLFLLREANRYITEHRDMRVRLTKLESKIETYENLGVLDKIYQELKGEGYFKQSTTPKKK